MTTKHKFEFELDGIDCDNLNWMFQREIARYQTDFIDSKDFVTMEYFISCIEYTEELRNKIFGTDEFYFTDLVKRMYKTIRESNN